MSPLVRPPPAPFVVVDRAGTGRCWPRPRLVAAIATLLAVHLVLAVAGVWQRSVTSDEPGHLTAGYSYWQLNDYRLQPENGNLPQRWAALPLLAVQPRFDRSPHPGDWAASRVWDIAQGFLFESGNNTDFNLLCARSIMLCWSVAAGLIVFAWARALWGDTGGVAALALFAFSPTTLAHGPLVTSDMCAAVCLLAATAAWWRMCILPSAGRVLLAGCATGLAALAKFSFLLLLPVVAVVAALTWWARTPLPRHAMRRLIAGVAGAGLVTYALIWFGYGFRYAAASPAAQPFGHFYLPWETVLAHPGGWTPLVQLARTCQLLPEAFIYGFSFVIYFARERGAFLAGNYSSTGWWWFFPFAFAVKSTIGELLAAALLGFQTIRWRRGLNASRLRVALAAPLAPLLVFAAVYAAFALASKLNIGQRHILPLYLVLFILAGSLVSATAPRVLRLAGLAAILFSTTESLSNLPHHLAFFNRLAGGPAQGWRLLVDSSLDWGQDVSALGSWVREHRQPGEQVYASCFGTADPAYEGIDGPLLAPYYSLGKPRAWFELHPGLYCVSATMLRDVYGLRPGQWTSRMESDYQNLKTAVRVNLASRTWSREIPTEGFHPEHPLWLFDRLRFARLCLYLRIRRPDAVINHTEFVFRLSAAELDTILDRPFSALVDSLERAADSRPLR